MEHPYHEILLRNKKEGTSDTHKDMSFQGITLRERSPSQTPQDSIYVTRVTGKIINLGNRFVVTRSYRQGRGWELDGGNVNWREVVVFINEQYEGSWW